MNDDAKCENLERKNLRNTKQNIMSKTVKNTKIKLVAIINNKNSFFLIFLFARLISTLSNKSLLNLNFQNKCAVF
jgi:hypothetical protein